MPQLISDIVKDSLVAQLGMEIENANTYLSIASYLKAKGFENLGEKFRKQFEEEQSHAMFLFNLLTDMNAYFEMPPINGFSLSQTPSILEIASVYLKKEIETTNNLKEIRIMAADESEGGCPVVERAILELISFQQSELEEASTFMDRAELIGSDWKTVLLWDFEEGE